MSTTSPSPDVPDGPGPSRRSRLLEPALIALLALTLNLAGNGRVSLWDRDEPRYAQCVREMRARGDWINPSFNAEPRYHKPILIYWLMRAGFALGGDNPFVRGSSRRWPGWGQPWSPGCWGGGCSGPGRGGSAR